MNYKSDLCHVQGFLQAGRGLWHVREGRQHVQDGKELVWYVDFSLWPAPYLLLYFCFHADCPLFAAAGNAFSQAARLHLQMQSKHDAATNFIDAGNAFKKADPQGKRVPYWHRMAPLYILPLQRKGLLTFETYSFEHVIYYCDCRTALAWHREVFLIRFRYPNENDTTVANYESEWFQKGHL